MEEENKIVNEQEAVEEEKAAAVEAEAAEEAEVTAETPENEEAEAQTEAAGEAEPEEKEEKRGFFKRKKDKEKEKLEGQVEELTDKLRRNLAEFDNYRKRTEKEKSARFDMGAKSVVEKILPVVDNFERGLKNAPEDDPFAAGMQMVYKQLTTALEDLGVKAIESVGQPFDPTFHNAVMHVEDEEAGDNVVVEEFQKGYMFKDAVVRPSMVKVAN